MSSIAEHSARESRVRGTKKASRGPLSFPSIIYTVHRVGMRKMFRRSANRQKPRKLQTIILIDFIHLRCFFCASASSRSSPLSVNCEFKCSITREAKRCWEGKRVVSVVIKDLRLWIHLSFANVQFFHIFFLYRSQRVSRKKRKGKEGEIISIRGHKNSSRECN